MPYGKNINLRILYAIEQGVARSTKWNEQLSVFWFQVLGRTTGIRKLLKYSNMLPNDYDCCLCDVYVFINKKSIRSLDTQDGIGQPHDTHMWHFGGSTSLPSSRLASQESASSPVRCTPTSWYSFHAAIPSWRNASRCSSLVTYVSRAWIISACGVRIRIFARFCNLSRNSPGSLTLVGIT